MTLTVGTDTYESLADIQAWNTARGYTGTITDADGDGSTCGVKFYYHTCQDVV